MAHEIPLDPGFVMLSKSWLTIKQMFRFNETPADTAMLYGLYKQGTVGDMPASTKEPTRVSDQENLNNIEWRNLRGLSPDSAQQRYISTITTITQRNGHEIDIDQLMAGMNLGV